MTTPGRFGRSVRKPTSTPAAASTHDTAMPHNATHRGQRAPRTQFVDVAVREASSSITLTAPSRLLLFRRGRRPPDGVALAVWKSRQELRRNRTAHVDPVDLPEDEKKTADHESVPARNPSGPLRFLLPLPAPLPGELVRGPAWTPRPSARPSQ